MVSDYSAPVAAPTAPAASTGEASTPTGGLKRTKNLSWSDQSGQRLCEYADEVRKKIDEKEEAFRRIVCSVNRLFYILLFCAPSSMHLPRLSPVLHSLSCGELSSVCMFVLASQGAPFLFSPPTPSAIASFSSFRGHKS
jgi:hypothetical protein